MLLKCHQWILAGISLGLVLLHVNAVAKPISFNYQIDYLQANMPKQQLKLGLVGIHVTHTFKNHFVFGSGMYAAMQGNYSGLFILGLDAGYQFNINPHVQWYAQAFAGSGGGHGLTRQMGNGGVLILQSGIRLPMHKFIVGAGYSALRVNGNHIHSNQWVLNLTVPFQLLLKQQKMSERISVYKHHIWVMPTLMVGIPDNAYTTNQQKITKKTGLSGVEVGQYISSYWFDFLHASASFYGDFSGYMDVRAGLGADLHSEMAVYPIVKLAIGSGGGGAVDLGRGVFYQAQAGLGLQLSSRLSLQLLGGYLSGLTGHYHLKTAMVGLAYHFGLYSPGVHEVSWQRTNAHTLQISLGNETYINPINPYNHNHAIQLFSVKLNALMRQHWLLSGETAFAYTGSIPGYATGLIGIGWQSSSANALQLYGKFLVGAAGGGHIDVSGGFVIKPTIGVRYQFNQRVSIYASVAKLKALKGKFSPVTVDAGLGFRFPLLGD